MATNTIWGPAQTSRKITRGIMLYTTASHGGYHVSPSMLARMPECLRVKEGWYEEDCEWSKVAMAFPEFFSEEQRQAAESTLRNWYPDAYEKLTGRVVTASESFARARQEFEDTTANKFVAGAAWGDWHGKVPPGMVGVIGRRKADKAEAWFLVPAEEYNSRDRLGFVCNPDVHSVWVDHA